MAEPHNIFEHDALAAHLGIELIDVGAGSAAARMQIKDHHCNSYGSVHGGALYALADVVFATASNSHGRVAVAIEANMSYFKAVSAGVLTATAEEVSRSHKLATYAIRITDEDDDLVALFHGTVYRKRDAVEDTLARTDPDEK